MEAAGTAVRKTFKYRLTPTPEHVRALETVLLRCRTLYNVALEQRKTWWWRGQGISATYYQQKAELPDLKVACPDYTEVHSQISQDVLFCEWNARSPRSSAASSTATHQGP
ncbi:MAG: helix-turn-helix domain-containing protein [Ktedonobacterales bacterium]